MEVASIYSTQEYGSNAREHYSTGGLPNQDKFGNYRTVNLGNPSCIFIWRRGKPLLVLASEQLTRQFLPGCVNCPTLSDFL